MDRNYKDNPDMFCYIFGHVVFLDSQAKATDLGKKTYEEYFGVRLRHQDKSIAPYTCCKTCVKSLLEWNNKKEKKMAFGKPMVWREMKDPITDCYFCMTNLKGINCKNKRQVQYPDDPFVKRPVPYGPGFSVLNVSVTVESSADFKIVHG